MRCHGNRVGGEAAARLEAAAACRVDIHQGTRRLFSRPYIVSPFSSSSSSAVFVQDARCPLLAQRCHCSLLYLARNCNRNTAGDFIPRFVPESSRIFMFSDFVIVCFDIVFLCMHVFFLFFFNGAKEDKMTAKKTEESQYSEQSAPRVPLCVSGWLLDI